MVKIGQRLTKLQLMIAGCCQWLKWAGQVGAQGTEASRGVRNLEYEHIMDNTICSLTLGAYATAGGGWGLKPEQGAEPGLSL